jgi:elongation factor P hydroxylase
LDFGLSVTGSKSVTIEGKLAIANRLVQGHWSQVKRASKMSRIVYKRFQADSKIKRLVKHGFVASAENEISHWFDVCLSSDLSDRPNDFLWQFYLELPLP